MAAYGGAHGRPLARYLKEVLEVAGASVPEVPTVPKYGIHALQDGDMSVGVLLGSLRCRSQLGWQTPLCA